MGVWKRSSATTTPSQPKNGGEQFGTLSEVREGLALAAR